MDSKEKELLQSLRGPSEALKADAARYMKDFAFRSSVDSADKQNSTQLGRTLKSIWYGKPATQDAPQVAEVKQQPSAVELAAAVKQFPRERCQELFKRESGKPGEVASSLSKEDYRVAKMASQFFGILPTDGSEPSVRFTYQTSRDRAAARQSKEDAAKSAAKREADFTPPGIERRPNGEILLIDADAFAKWKASKNENSEAIAFLEEQAK
jgi:hypothetical protein